jgi:alkylated DNA repair protein alkB family protein 6
MDFLKLLKEEKEKLRREALQQKNTETGEKLSSVSSREHHTQNENSIHLPESIELFPFRKVSLDDYRLDCGISNIYYIPSIIQDEYANFLVSSIEAAASRWIILRNRKLQLWGKLPASLQLPSPDYDEKIPAWLENIIQEEISLGVFSEDVRPNNILINQYEADQGIMHHTDGPSYYNRVAILSLESTVILTFKPKLAPAEIGLKSDEDVISVVLEPKSLLIFSDDLYDSYMHGIYAQPLHIVGRNGTCVNLHHTGLQDGDEVSRSSFFLFILIIFIPFRLCDLVGPQLR